MIIRGKLLYFQLVLEMVPIVMQWRQRLINSVETQYSWLTDRKYLYYLQH